jgi:hypothetical protein
MRHFSQRQIVTSPQFGQGNLTAPSPGRIVRAHHVQVGMRMIFSVVAATLNGILLGGAHTHAAAGYKLIAELRMEKRLRASTKHDRQIQTRAYEHSIGKSHLLRVESKVGQNRFHL